jgi:hypothetical protein
MTKDLIESYGELSYEDVKQQSETYVNSETRSAQDLVMLYLRIMASLTEAGQEKVRSRGLSYPFMSGDKGVGTLLLKVVVMVAHLDTRATVTQVRTKLSSLDKTMKDMDSDIEKFNDHVLTLATKLQSRGEATQDLLVNLFIGYKACKDAEFVEYIKKKEDFYEEGGDFAYGQLMDWALNKFRARVKVNSGVRGPLRRRPLLHFKLKSRSYSHLPWQTRKEGRKASPRESPRKRSRLLIRKDAPPTSGRRLRQRKVNRPQSKRVERNGIGAPNTRHGPSTRNRNARELTSSQATIVSRKSQSQRIQPRQE